MINLPDYWLPRPPMNIDPSTEAAFETLLAQAAAQDAVTQIDYTLPAPKWQFLCWLADRHNLAMHGSGSHDITCFEPRGSNDLSEFGRQVAVFAAADGIWAMFFAIVDRASYPVTVSNAGIRLEDPDGQTTAPFYIFSITQEILPQQPWRSGFVYILPSETFIPQPSLPFGDYQVHILQLASPVPVTPIACLEVSPLDFPFLAQIRGHDDNRLAEYLQAFQSGAPWPD